MSQPDLIAQLREARPVAPPEVHERVRLIALEAGVPPRRRVTWRRSAILVLAAVAVAIVAGLAFFSGGKTTQPSSVALLAQRTLTTSTGAAATTLSPLPRDAVADLPLRPTPYAVPQTPEATKSAAQLSRQSSGAYGAFIGATEHPAPGPSPTRIQRYTALLDLELQTPSAVSTASRKAVAIAISLSGYQQSVVVRTTAKAGYAHIVLRVPSGNVREAVRRLSALGKITGENVAIKDLQVQVNTTDQKIGRLQLQLTALVAQPQTAELDARIASVTAQIERLQRSRAATVRAAHYATVDLQLATKQAAAAPKKEKHEPGPLHGLGTAFHWAWIGAVYAFALGTPVIVLIAIGFFLARSARRRREDRLLAS